jgi:uncharacterized protein (DUF1800 family)
MPLAPRFLSRQMLCLLLASPWQWVAAQAPSDAAAWRLAACSRADVENPLLARMTEFWFNHLNVFAGKGAVRPFVGHYVLNAIRPHALGRFEDLLLASARHPAMLLYLDQAQSVAEGSPVPRRPQGVASTKTTPVS